jgi:hypothetical protein
MGEEMNDEAKLKWEEVKKKVREELLQKKIRLEELLAKADFIDDDGYPTGDALEAIELWDWKDARGWFKFIEGLWHLRSWGWSEHDEPHEWSSWDNQYKDKIVHKYEISTAGWSGNESIIRAMENNEMMWHLNWEQSRRGGHYIFELKEFNDD